MSIQRAALGRVARHGDLYNACTDSFCEGLSIFGSEFPASLIQAVPNRLQKCNIVRADSRSDRCDNLNLQDELKLSVFALDVPLRGCAKYLAANYGPEKKSTVSVVCQCRTTTDKLDFFSDEAKSLVSLDELKGCAATHVVFEIQRGADAVLALNFGYSDNDERKRISDELSEVLRKTAVKRILENEEDRNLETAPYSSNDVSLEFYTDVAVSGEQEAESMEDHIELLQKLSTALDEDAEKARPVVYTLIQLHVVALVAKGRLDFERPLHPHDEMNLKAVIHFLDNLENQRRRHKQILKNRKNALSLPENGFTHNENGEPTAVIAKIDAVKQQIGCAIKEFRIGKQAAIQIQELLETFKILLEEMEQCSSGQPNGDPKFSYLAALKDSGVFITHNREVFEKKILVGSYYVFCANLDAMDETFLEVSQVFEELYHKDAKNCILYDISALTDPEVLSNHVIMYCVDGVCIEDDVFRMTKLLKDCNVVRYTAEPKPDAILPEEVAHAEVRCPKGCGRVKRKWICYYCLKTVYYGFKDRFYCDCGEADVYATEWWCQDSEHGIICGRFAKFHLDMELRDIQPCQERNVLLLGETGTGKSTWINSIANYVIWDGLDTALEHPLTYLIPSSFFIQTSTFEGRTVKVGKSEDESFKVGQSSTRMPRSYSFMYNNTRIRLIDVPGMCDTRGPRFDDHNFDLILQKLQTIKELHAICILLTPDKLKLTVAFQYCISGLLTHLHKSAADNIVFCFTNTRRTLYRAGETLPVLKKYLKRFEERRQVKIQLSEKTMYLFDNEAFKFLCAAKEGVVFSEKEKEAYKESWDTSASETFRFLHYLMNIKPHLTREMIGVNEARRIIIALTRPLADITDNINLNIRLIKEAKKECESLELTAPELESRLEVKKITLVAIPIDYPRTTCASAKCTEIQVLPDTKVPTTHYKQNCHEHCYLKGIEVGKYPDPRLRQCWAMELGNAENCRTCGCPWDVHLHVKYLQQQREITVVDETTQRLLKRKQDREILIEKQDVLAAYDRQLEALEKRHKRLTDICANFGSFLECNCIVPYNDALVEYLEWAIKVARQNASLCEGSKKEDYLEKAEGLAKQMSDYVEEVRILKTRLQNEDKKITLDEIVRMKEELYSMSSDDCNIASYLKVLEDADDRHVMKQDQSFKADEYILNGYKKKKLPNTSWFSKTLKRGPLIRNTAKSNEKNREPRFNVRFRRATPPPTKSYTPTRPHAYDAVAPFRSVAGEIRASRTLPTLSYPVASHPVPERGARADKWISFLFGRR